MDDIRGETPNAESYQLFMMPQAATTLHRPLVSYQAIFAVAHARESAIPEVIFDVRQHSLFPLSGGCTVTRFRQFLTGLESLVAGVSGFGTRLHRLRVGFRFPVIGAFRVWRGSRTRSVMRANTDNGGLMNLHEYMR
jgi:hypothetical protein